MFSGLYECLAGCGELYCSPECRTEHFQRCHRLLCVGPVPEEEAHTHPLVAFRVRVMVVLGERFIRCGARLNRKRRAVLRVWLVGCQWFTLVVLQQPLKYCSGCHSWISTTGCKCKCVKTNSHESNHAYVDIPELYLGWLFI